MADQADEKSGVEKAAVSFEANSLGDQLATIKRALKASPVRKWLLWTSVGIMAVIVATSIGQLLLNRWNQPFYDTLA
ncbi:ABC transporter ATP-binding protein/permease, partial [Mesorhizobium sp. M8A.F.Ca.ET.059.01.1.1]